MEKIKRLVEKIHPFKDTQSIADLKQRTITCPEFHMVSTSSAFDLSTQRLIDIKKN
jgi:hypothetical protein